MRGEKPTPGGPPAQGARSPPRARGKASAGSMMQKRIGITPACAGKSLHYNIIVAEVWDHPRVRGEKTPAAAADL